MGKTLTKSAKKAETILKSSEKSTGKMVLTVKTNTENPEPLEVIASAIIEVADALNKINNGPLKQHTVILLIQDITKLPQRDIKKVLDAATVIKNVFLKK